MFPFTPSTTEAPADFAAEVRRVRSSRRLTPAQLATELGVDARDVERWESGEPGLTVVQQATVLMAIGQPILAGIIAPPVMFPWGVLDTVIYLTTRVIAERHGRGILAARTRVRVTVTVTRAAADLNATPQQVANAELALLDAGLLAGLTLAELREVLATELVEG